MRCAQPDSVTSDNQQAGYRGTWGPPAIAALYVARTRGPDAAPAQDTAGTYPPENRTSLSWAHARDLSDHPTTYRSLRAGPYGDSASTRTIPRVPFLYSRADRQTSAESSRA